MNQNTVSKVAGKKFEPTLNGIYKFSGVAGALLFEIAALPEAYGGVATERDGYRFHIIYAGNGTYFKYNGPGSEYRCINLIAEDIEAGESWIVGCLLYRGAKEAKATIRLYRDIALKSTIPEIEEKRKNEREMYTWRYFKVEGDVVYSIKQLEEKVS